MSKWIKLMAARNGVNRQEQPGSRSLHYAFPLRRIFIKETEEARLDVPGSSERRFISCGIIEARLSFSFCFYHFL